MLYLSTCVGLGYGLCGGYFQERLRCQTNPIRIDNTRHPSLTHWLTNINVIPIHYGFRPRVRGRLTLRRLALRRNPWTFGERVSHPLYRYSCQHSHFRYLQQTSRFTFIGLRNAPLPLITEPAISAYNFSPDTFSAQDRLMSELLRFL